VVDLLTFALICVFAFMLGVFLGIVIRLIWLFVLLALGLSATAVAGTLALLDWLGVLDWSRLAERAGSVRVDPMAASMALNVLFAFALGLILGSRVVGRLENWIGFLIRRRGYANP